MELKDLKKLIHDFEEQRKTIPKGKVLISGNKELIERMKLEGWQGEYVYTDMIESDVAYMVEKGFAYKPVPNLSEGTTSNFI